jgi:hypothetical protein
MKRRSPGIIADAQKRGGKRIEAPLQGAVIDAPDTPEAREAEAEAIRYILEVNERIRKEKKKKIHDQFKTDTDAA